MEVSEGVGQNREQLTIRMSTSLAVIPVFLNKSSKQLNMTSSASCRDVSMFSTGGFARIPGGKYVDSPYKIKQTYCINIVNREWSELERIIKKNVCVCESTSPVLSINRCMKSIESGLKSNFFCSSMNASVVIIKLLSGLKVA